jgi:predicted RNase H-like HicB family nuclease
MDPQKYLVILEHAEGSNYSAYVPDLPGCVSTGDSRQEVMRNIREAIALHLEGMREDGDPIPAPSSEADYVEAIGGLDATTSRPSRGMDASGLGAIRE